MFKTFIVSVLAMACQAAELEGAGKGHLGHHGGHFGGHQGGHLGIRDSSHAGIGFGGHSHHGGKQAYGGDKAYGGKAGLAFNQGGDFSRFGQAAGNDAYAHDAGQYGNDAYAAD